MKQGEVFRCSDRDCGCEITVTKAPRRQGPHAPRCCCGAAMVSKQTVQTK